MSETNQPPADAGQGTPEGETGKVYSESQFKELVKQRDELKTRMREIEAKQKEAEEKRVQETQEFRSAYEKLKPEYDQKSQRLEELEARENARLERFENELKAGIEKLSDADKAEYAEFIAKLDPEARHAWVTKRSGAVQTKVNSPGAARPGQTQRSAVSVEQIPYSERIKAFQAAPNDFRKALVR